MQMTNLRVRKVETRKVTTKKGTAVVYVAVLDSLLGSATIRRQEPFNGLAVGQKVSVNIGPTNHTIPVVKNHSKKSKEAV